MQEDATIFSRHYRPIQPPKQLFATAQCSGTVPLGIFKDVHQRFSQRFRITCRDTHKPRRAGHDIQRCRYVRRNHRTTASQGLDGY
jgi:hypothetical protein